MKTVFTCIFAFTCWFSAACAEMPADTTPTPHSYIGGRRMVGLNMTPLMTQLIPFNRSNPNEAGPYLARFKWYGAREKYAFRMSMGFHTIVSDNGSPDDVQFNFGFGWERRRSLGKRWAYSRGCEFVLLAGDLNIPGSNNNDDDGSETILLGLGPLWGFEYALEKRVSLGIEAQLIFGLDLDDGLPQLQIIPPVGLFLHYYF